jgi:hypothetical protein
MTQKLAYAIAAVAVTATICLPEAAHAFALRGGVISNGAANNSAGGGIKMFGTLGQPAVGLSTSTTFRLCHGFWCFGGSRVLAVDPGPGVDHGPALPTEISFSAPTPNPSRGDVRFRIGLPEAAEVTFTVYDVSGRQVGDPVRRTFGAGWHQLAWSAPADHPGVYFARIGVDGALKATKRIVLIR